MMRLTFVVLIVFTCTFVRAQEIKHITSFQSDIPLKETIIAKFTGSCPSGILLTNDTIALLRNATGERTAHFNLWNLRRKNSDGMVLPVGNKSGHAFSFLSFGFRANRLWVYDINKEKVVSYFQNAANGFTYAGEYTVQPFYYSADFLNDSVIAATGYYDGDYKIYLHNVLQNKMVAQYAPYQKKANEPMAREEKMAFESFIVAKPSGDKCVLASRYTDRLEIVNLKENSSLVINGPNGFAPDVMYARGNDGKMLSTRNSQTRYAFLKIKATDKYIYLLFSGHNHLSDHLHYGNVIYVFDWQGTPVKKLLLEKDVIDFAVDSADTKLYALRPVQGVMVEAKLD